MEKINVTKSYLPPMEEYLDKISTIWDNHSLSNFGPLHAELEEKLKEYLNVDNLHYVVNGTMALQLSIEALNNKNGEIITTPFTFVATASSIVWQKYKPIFVDIEPTTFNINVDKIEEKINDRTRAILAVHCFGYPCDVLKLDSIAKKYNIPLIYDAAHCFGVKIENKSIFKYGDISTCSLHATKVFHTVEGGLCIVNNPLYNEKILAMKRFGNSEFVGINAKSSEFHAAMGLCLLNHFEEIVNYRKYISSLYRSYLSNEIYIPNIPSNVQYNYIYFPVVLKTEKQLLEIIKKLNEENIYPRRYFYPCLNEIPIYKDDSVSPIAFDISKRILCLPLDTYLKEEQVKRICFIINEVIKNDKKIKILNRIIDY